MNNSNDKAKRLIDELLTFKCTEKREDDIMSELDKIIIDPKWSDYIFYSEDYLFEDDSLNYEKFFQKISEYENSDEYKRNKYIISLVNNLLNKNFEEKSEVAIVNELNNLITNKDWIDCLFVSKSCFLEDGLFYEKEFLRLMDLIDFTS